MAHCNVEWQNGFHTMCHIEGGVPCCLASGGVVCPKDEGGNRGPLRRIAVTCFDQQIAYGSVLSLHDAIGPRVVSQDMDVTNSIPAGQPVQCHNVGGPIICYYLLNCSPSTQNLFEDEGAERAASLCSEGMPFRPCGE